MEVMIHFIFTMVKISVQASIYALALLLIFRCISRLKSNSWIDRVSVHGTRFWFIGGILIFVALFGFLFSYWGFHGFGDGPRVPIGHDLFVDNTNWTEYGYVSSIKTGDGHVLMMTSFTVVDGKLLGNLDSWFGDFKNEYFIYKMETGELKEFSTLREFDRYAFMNHLPGSTSLRTFAENYNERWGGWWFWFLP